MIQSAATKYAIRAVCHLAHLSPGERAQVREVAEALDIPQAFLSKILQDLARKGILTSAKGARRRFPTQLLAVGDKPLLAGRGSRGSSPPRGVCPSRFESLLRRHQVSDARCLEGHGRPHFDLAWKPRLSWDIVEADRRKREALGDGTLLECGAGGRREFFPKKKINGTEYLE